MRMLALAALIWLAAASSGQTAQTGQSLKDLCENEAPNIQGVCVGYVIAVADILTQFSNEESYFLGFRACMPEISVVEAQQAVVKYLNENPDKSDKAAFSLVARALSETHPCQ